MKADLLIPAWFLLPWLVVAAKITRDSIYETRFGLMKDLSPFGFRELMRRINERRKVDQRYDEMKKDTKKWAVITFIWGVSSFVVLVGGALLYGTFKS